MLAMMIVATLIPILYGAMRLGFSSKAKAEAAVEPARSAELSLDLLREDLGDALPPTGTLANAFTGTDGKDDRGRDADDLKFYSNATAPQDGTAIVNGEIKSIELKVIIAPNGDHVLVRQVVRDVLSQIQGNQVTPDVEVICRGVGGFNLRYFDGYHWGETWDSTQTQFDNQLPAAVEVTLTLDRPDGTPNGTKSIKYVRVIPLACSYAAYDTNVQSGFTEAQ
jgi:hypothetical protein